MQSAEWEPVPLAQGKGAAAFGTDALHLTMPQWRHFQSAQHSPVDDMQAG